MRARCRRWFQQFGPQLLRTNRSEVGDIRRGRRDWAGEVRLNACYATGIAPITPINTTVLATLRADRRPSGHDRATLDLGTPPLTFSLRRVQAVNFSKYAFA